MTSTSPPGSSTEPASLTAIITQVVQVQLPTDDGLAFDPAAMQRTTIRDEDAYSGLRLTMPVALATARQRLSLDIGTGDPIEPPAELVDVPRVLGGSIQLQGYPVEMVLAEKIVTAIQRGTSNTRWRDFADVLTLLRHERIDGDRLHTSVMVVADHRGAMLGLISDVLDSYTTAAGPRWGAWRRTRERAELPVVISDVVDELAAFADPVLNGDVAGRRWDPHTSTWA